MTPTGYTVVLPPGWTRVPLRDGTEETIEQILDGAFAGLAPESLVAEKKDLRDRLRNMAAAAAADSGVDLYLPTERSHGFTVAASFIAAEVNFGSMEQPGPALVLARIAARKAATRTVTIAETTAVRTETVVPADPTRDIPFASRRVDYVLPVPEDADRWVLVTFSTIGQGDPQDDFAGLLVDLFDAIMTTFRWTT